MFTKCLRPICHQYTRDCLRERQTYYQKQLYHARDAISLHVRDIEGCVDTCVGCKIVEYLFIGPQSAASGAWFLLTVRVCVLSTIINIDCPDGVTYSLKRFTYRSIHRARVVSVIVGS